MYLVFCIFDLIHVPPKSYLSCKQIDFSWHQCTFCVFNKNKCHVFRVWNARVLYNLNAQTTPVLYFVRFRLIAKPIFRNSDYVHYAIQQEKTAQTFRKNNDLQLRLEFFYILFNSFSLKRHFKTFQMITIHYVHTRCRVNVDFSRNNCFSKKIRAFMRNRILCKILSFSYLLHIFILKCNTIHWNSQV